MSGVVVCVLFSDLVGSTELMTALGDAAYDGLRAEHFARLRQVVADFAGSEVKNTGDGLLVSFASAAQAIGAAAAMQTTTAEHARRLGRALSIRVGLSLGEVTAEDGDIFGSPVVEAARLVGAARPGQILATSLVKAVAGSRAPAAVTDLGAMTLKGLPEPVAVCEVAWAAGRSAVPVPALLTGSGVGFVGRASELNLLTALWSQAASGRQRIALLGGEPGVGKTRLAAEMATRVHADGGVVLAGRCDEDLGVPYQPFVESLRHYARAVAHEGRRLGRYAGDLVRLLPELAELDGVLPPALQSDPETERYRLFDAVASWLADVAAEAPVLLILDDLQWATKPTLLLLRHITRSTEVHRVLVLATYRDTELTRGHPLTGLLADLRRQEAVERMPVTGLDAGAVAAFMAQAAGHELDEDGRMLADSVWAETEGNPFFVGEVLHHLAESGGLARRDGRWSTTSALADIGVPAGVREVVGRRVSRLSPAAGEVLRMAAVMGAEFDLAELSVVCRMDAEALAVALEEAVDARLVAATTAGPVPAYRFEHALVRVTLHEESSPPRRAAMHRRVALALESLHADRIDDHVTALAHHWSRAAATAAETAPAVAYTVRAGDRAFAQLAHDEAAGYYRAAVELLDVAASAADERRLTLLIKLGEAQHCAGDPGYRRTLLDACALARARGDVAALARAALANSAAIKPGAFVAPDHERVAELEAALEAVGPSDDPVRARLLAALGLELYRRDPDRRVALSDAALAMARRLGDTGALAQVLAGRSYAVDMPHRVETRWADTAELLGIAAQVDDPVLRLRAEWLRFRVAAERGDVAEMRRCLAAQKPLAADLGQPGLRWLVGGQQFGFALFQGRLAEAERFALAALADGEAAEAADARLFYACQMLLLRREQGRPLEAVERMEVASRAWSGWPILQLGLALLHLDAGDEAGARACRATVRDAGPAPYDNLWLTATCFEAELVRRLDDGPAMAELYERLGPFGAHFAVFGTAPLVGMVVHHLGTLAAGLGRHELAEGHFAEALDGHEGRGARIWAARTRVEWARMLLRRGGPGDRARATGLLSAAAEAAAAADLVTLGRDARRLLGESVP